jgi:hypothetical protein
MHDSSRRGNDTAQENGVASPAENGNHLSEARAALQVLSSRQGSMPAYRCARNRKDAHHQDGREGAELGGLGRRGNPCFYM